MNQPGTDQEYPNWRLPLADEHGQPGAAGRPDPAPAGPASLARAAADRLGLAGSGAGRRAACALTARTTVSRFSLTSRSSEGGTSAAAPGPSSQAWVRSASSWLASSDREQPDDDLLRRVVGPRVPRRHDRCRSSARRTAPAAPGRAPARSRRSRPPATRSAGRRCRRRWPRPPAWPRASGSPPGPRPRAAARPRCCPARARPRSRARRGRPGRDQRGQQPPAQVGVDRPGRAARARPRAGRATYAVSAARRRRRRRTPSAAAAGRRCPAPPPRSARAAAR